MRLLKTKVFILAIGPFLGFFDVAYSLPVIQNCRPAVSGRECEIVGKYTDYTISCGALGDGCHLVFPGLYFENFNVLQFTTTPNDFPVEFPILLYDLVGGETTQTDRMLALIMLSKSLNEDFIARVKLFNSWLLIEWGRPLRPLEG